LARRFFSSFPVRGGDAGQTVDPFDQKDITGVSIAEKPKQLGTREHGIALILDIPGGDRQAAFGGESLDEGDGARCAEHQRPQFCD
jgi:hypothetical protein